MVVFALFMIILMLIVAGMAVDFVRFENSRARLQTTLDRAVLAAASLDNELQPRDVVQSYIDAAGLTANLGRVEVQQQANERTVTATASADMPAIFLPLVGIESLLAPAASVASEQRQSLEIALVVDISGSMAQNRRIENLRSAADTFVAYMFDEYGPDYVSFSVVPYATQVSLPRGMIAQYDVPLDHEYSFCVDLPDDVYDSAGIPPTHPLRQGGHMDARTGGASHPYRQFYFANCNTDPAAVILPVSNDEDGIRRMIAALGTQDMTSIEMGVKWGAALLDPSARPVIDGMIASGEVGPAMAGRPFDYDRPNTRKILIVMSDGYNRFHYEMRDAFRSGLSDIWTDGTRIRVQDFEVGDRDGDGRPGENLFDPDTRRFESIPALTISGPADARTQERVGTTTWRRLTWPDLFARVSVRGHAYDFRRNQTGNDQAYVDWFWASVDYLDEPVKNDRLNRICDAADAAGITVFSIGFEVYSEFAQPLADCASTPQNFYTAEGDRITDVYMAIAHQISALRLTQ
ncbi:TadE/TadG family type IV pilus assembly protein [Wenxinia saemankumensis]|uniref:Flp pilus assembly protein TadG n=1 Tax=Wenxinia saemankumensis TaxID=1447782 RepID=A0A1M6GZD9_9RHOB|nr:TadE/TadG family type IV pilus assembly protein [Wenxinia saemankumensis]SHJ15274.1 Flp pilus assembly protein TadG [Wenxinia saemankumensis]